MKECPFCKEDNMSKAVYCCMCGKQFPNEKEEPEKKQGRRFVAFNAEDSSSDTTEKKEERKPSSRFKPIL